jgi:hypothetical protein
MAMFTHDLTDCEVTVDGISLGKVKAGSVTFEAEYQCAFYEPSKEEKHQTEVVEKYFRRCDGYDAAIETLKIPPREITHMMQVNSREVLEELAKSEGTSVVRIKTWISRYNRRKGYE